jgi:hypothetical protein
MIGVSHKAGKLGELRGILGNDKKLPFPDGTILAKLAWKQEQEERTS